MLYILVPVVESDDIDGEGIDGTAVVTVVLCVDELLKHVAAIIIKQLLKQHTGLFGYLTCYCVNIHRHCSIYTIVFSK